MDEGLASLYRLPQSSVGGHIGEDVREVGVALVLLGGWAVIHRHHLPPLTEGGGDHCSPELAAGSGYSEAHLCPIITVLGGWLGRRGAWSCMGAGGCMGG